MTFAYAERGAPSYTASVALIGPGIEPSDVNDGRGWSVSFGDGVAHQVQIGHNSALTGMPRSFKSDDDTHKLALGSPRTVSFTIAGRPATLTRRWEREGAGAFLRRYFTSVKAFLPGSQQRHLTLYYTLNVDGDAGGTWIADMPNNVLRAWRFVPDAA